MTLKIIHKNNTSAGQAPAPSDLDIGEIAVNSADAQLYVKDNDGAIQSFTNDNDAATVQRFTQSGSGAVQRTIESKLRDAVSVKDFGAVGDGVTDDTAAINAAIAASAVVSFPAGTYRITDRIANDYNQICLIGEGGSKVTTILVDCDIDQTIRIRGTSSAILENSLVKGFTFREAQARTRTNKLLYFLQCLYAHVEDLQFFECASALTMVEVSNSTWMNCNGFACRGAGIFLQNVIGLTAVGGLWTGPRKAPGSPNSVAGDNGLHMLGSCSGVHFSEFGFVSWHISTLLEASPAGYGPEWVSFQRTGWDNGEDYNLKIEACQGFQAVSCWVGYAGAGNGGNLTPGSAEVAIHISSAESPANAGQANTQFVHFINTLIFASRREGVIVTDAGGISPKDILFSGCKFNANSAVDPGGHIFLNGSDNFRLTDCYFGTTINNDTSQAQYCVQFAPGKTNSQCSLIGNLWGNYSVAKFGGVVPDDCIIFDRETCRFGVEGDASNLQLTGNDDTDGIFFANGLIALVTNAERRLIATDTAVVAYATLRPDADETRVLGGFSTKWSAGYIKDLRPGDGTVKWTSGAGSPEGVVGGEPGSLYTRTDGGADTTLYVKESGSGASGWVAK